jgi:hypothetical protein
MHELTKLAQSSLDPDGPARFLQSERRRDYLTLTLILLTLATLLVPVLLVSVPPLFDYSNHLVRLWLIAGGAATPPVSEMYAVTWSQAFTNVGIDYVGAALGLVVPATTLGATFVALAVVLPPLGALSVNRVTFGGPHWSQIGILFFAWNATLIAGFLNFHIGLGLALFGAALEPRLAHSSIALRTSARLAIASLVLVAHIFALFFYCCLLAGLAFGRDRKALASWRAFARRLTGAAAAAAIAAAPGLVYIAFAPALPGAHTDAIGNAPVWDFSLYTKGYALLSPIATYALPVDVAFTIALAAPLVWAAATGRIEAHVGLMLAAAGITIVALLAPTAVAGTWWIDNRFPLMAVLALLAGVRPEANVAPAARLAIAALLASIVIARTGWITMIWHDRQSDVRAVERAVSSLPPGAAVLPLDNVDESAGLGAHPLGRLFHNGHPTYWSYPVLAIMWRHAFVPNLFWATGKQPLRVLPPWNEISYPEDSLWRSQILIDPNQTPTHFRQWRQRYDYVLLLNADVGNGPDLSVVPELRLERDEGFARLYRIAKARPLPSGG